MRNKKKQMKENIRYLIDELSLSDEDVGQMLRCAEKLGVSCQYFVEEFVVGGSEDIHLDDYLRIPNFSE
tara:strand:+ start:489 stop:695 length:207 start_codon:yes stop_codon:yes gene_type:complete